MGQFIQAEGTKLWVECRGQGPDVLLLHGLGDSVEAWQSQLDGLADRYRLVAVDNRGAGRSPLPEEPLSVDRMADDAAAVLRALDIPAAHVAGYSGGSLIAQELAIRHPDLVRSLVLVSTWARLDSYARSWLDFLRWLPDVAPSERAFLEAFFLWFYTPRAYANGMIEQLVEAALAFPYKPSAESLRQAIDAYGSHETIDHLPLITAPTLVMSGGIDLTTGPRFGRVVADAIPGAQFEILPTEAHQPFQEIPRDWNARVDAFWQEVERGG